MDIPSNNDYSALGDIIDLVKKQQEQYKTLKNEIEELKKQNHQLYELIKQLMDNK